MASLPGYYLSSAAAIVYLPVIEAHEAQLGEESGDNIIETDGGKRYVYNLFTREIGRMSYRVTGSQLAAFRTMHDVVKGLAFYFVTSDGVTIYCRKQVTFIYQRLRAVSLYDVPLDISGEPTDAEIDA